MVKAGDFGPAATRPEGSPMDSESSEGSLVLANTVLKHRAEKLPISRWQRDLTDSTVLRNMGVGLGYSLLAYDSLLKGMSKLEVNADTMKADLDANLSLIHISEPTRPY